MHRAVGVPEPIRQLGAIPFGWSGGPLVGWRAAQGVLEGNQGVGDGLVTAERAFCSPIAGRNRTDPGCSERVARDGNLRGRGEWGCSPCSNKEWFRARCGGWKTVAGTGKWSGSARGRRKSMG